MKLTLTGLRTLIRESITDFQCLQHSAGFIEPNGTAHVLHQERLSGRAKTGSGRISFKRGPISHARYLELINKTRGEVKGWLYISNVGEVFLVDAVSSLESITGHQWDTYFKEFFEPCIDSWNRVNKGKEFSLSVGREYFTLERLFQNKHISNSLT